MSKEQNEQPAVRVQPLVMWPECMRKPYENLLEARDVLVEHANAGRQDEYLQVVEALPKLEKAILIAWADATKDANPTMHRNVESGLYRWCGVLEKKVRRDLGLDRAT